MILKTAAIVRSVYLWQEENFFTSFALCCSMLSTAWQQVTWICHLYLKRGLLLPWGGALHCYNILHLKNGPHFAHRQEGEWMTFQNRGSVRRRYQKGKMFRQITYLNSVIKCVAKKIFSETSQSLSARFFALSNKFLSEDLSKSTNKL